MPNRINYQLEMEKVLAHAGRHPPEAAAARLLCASAPSAQLERLSAHFDLTILYYKSQHLPAGGNTTAARPT